MSSIRRPIASRKRQTPSAGVVPLVAGAMPGEAPSQENPASSASAAQDTREDLLKEIHGQLLDQQSLDGGEVDQVMEHFRAAIADASLEPSATTPADMLSWIQILEETVLADQDASEEDERNALLRQIGDLKNSFQNHDLQVALEYVQRLQEYGEEDAVAWLASRQAEKETAKVSAQVNEQGMADVAPQSITRSKSRRLRGPPRG